MLPSAIIIIITLALFFYTVGVWGERVQRILTWWHTASFGLGLVADAAGTLLMTRIADTRRDQGITPGGLNTVMAVSGTIAILLTAVHLSWAVVVMLRDREHENSCSTSSASAFGRPGTSPTPPAPRPP